MNASQIRCDCCQCKLKMEILGRNSLTMATSHSISFLYIQVCSSEILTVGTGRDVTVQKIDRGHLTGMWEYWPLARHHDELERTSRTENTHQSVLVWWSDPSVFILFFTLSQALNLFQTSQIINVIFKNDWYEIRVTNSP